MTNIEQLENALSDLKNAEITVDEMLRVFGAIDVIQEFITAYKNQYHIDKDKLEEMKKPMDSSQTSVVYGYNQAIDDVIKLS